MSEDKVYDYTIDQLLARIKELEEHERMRERVNDQLRERVGGLQAHIKELEALLERARERIYSGPVSVDPTDALWIDIGRGLAAAEKPNA